MIHLFFILCIFPIMVELTHIITPRFVLLLKLKSTITSRLGLKTTDAIAVYNQQELQFILMELFYTVWLFLGLFTSYWYVYLCIFGISIIKMILNRFKTFNKLALSIIFVDGTITLVLLLLPIVDMYTGISVFEFLNL